MSNPQTIVERAFVEARHSFGADPASRFFALALLAANLVLILVSFGLAASHKLGWQPTPLPDPWNVSREYSVPEYLNYIQTGLCALFTLLCWFRTRVHAQLFLAIVFAFIVFDDSYGYHETLGIYLAEWWHLPASPLLRPEDTGEILAWLIAATVLFVPMLAALRQKRSRSDPLSTLLWISLGSLIFFAIGLDMVHQAAGGGFIGHIEDGGEMLSMAFACSCSFVFYRAVHRSTVTAAAINTPAP